MQSAHKTIYRAFKYPAKPTATQQKRMHAWFAAVRYVYNCALEQRSAAYDHWKKHYAHRIDATSKRKDLAPAIPYQSNYAQSAELKHVRAEFPWLKDCPADFQHTCLADLDEAFKKLYSGGGFPSFRSKYGINSFAQPGFRNGREQKIIKYNANSFGVEIVKLGFLTIRCDRGVPKRGKLKRISVSYDGKRFWVSIVCAIEIGDERSAQPMVGIDRGVAVPVMLSDGRSFDLPTTLQELQAKKKKAQRTLSRRKVKSNRWVKQKKTLARISARLANVRKDWQHKTTRQIVDEFGYVAVENLNTQGMTKSAKGDAENPGKNVRAKAGLNREILNVGWYELERQLDYKLEEKGGELFKVDPRYTSQMCSACGKVDPESRKSQAQFSCSHCGHKMNADHNAAINILNKQRGICEASLDVEDADCSADETLTIQKSTKRSRKTTTKTTDCGIPTAAKHVS